MSTPPSHDSRGASTMFPEGSGGWIIGLCLGSLVVGTWALSAPGAAISPPPPAQTMVATTQGTPTISSEPRDLTEQESRAWLERESTSYRVSTDGHTLVELSAKFVGATDTQLTAANGGHTFYFKDIVAEYRQLREKFGEDVHMVKSTAFGKQTINKKVPKGEFIYVTIYDPRAFPSRSDAAAWCQRNFPGLSGAELDNVCLPRTATQPH